MYLPRTSCIICSEHITKIKYNLKTTHSETSNILLIKFVEKFYKNIFFLHCNICSDCYDLINELDSIRHREKELYTRLKSHIAKLDDSKVDTVDASEDDYVSAIALSSNAFPLITQEDDNAPFSAFCEENNVKIPDVDLKQLPIKIKRLPSKKNNHHSIPDEPRHKSKSVASNRTVFDENEKAFEQIQTSIQMDLSKHVEELMNKCKPGKNLLCEICGQNFKTKLGYDNHMKKHDDVEDEIKLLALNKMDNNWFCNVCGKNFNQRGALGRHLPIHTGETRYQCEECGKKFLHHSSFNMHRKIHTGQRDYKCDTCNHRFLTNSHLKRHIRATHNKEKTRTCKICGKKFSENYNLVAHMNTAHKELLIAETLQEEESSAIYYQVQEEAVVKEETLVHLAESPTTTVLYTL